MPMSLVSVAGLKNKQRPLLVGTVLLTDRRHWKQLDIETLLPTTRKTVAVDTQLLGY